LTRAACGQGQQSKNHCSKSSQHAPLAQQQQCHLHPLGFSGAIAASIASAIALFMAFQSSFPIGIMHFCSPCARLSADWLRCVNGAAFPSRTNPLNYLPQINQRSLISKRNLQSDTVRLLNDSLDLCLDNYLLRFRHIYVCSRITKWRIDSPLSSSATVIDARRPSQPRVCQVL
jgi:hypothetical protein